MFLAVFGVGLVAGVVLGIVLLSLAFLAQRAEEVRHWHETLAEFPSAPDSYFSPGLPELQGQIKRSDLILL